MNGSNSPSARSPATDGGQRARFVARFGIVLLVFLACVVRLIHLDADPVFSTWIGYIVDEGRWNESARNMVLFGTTDAFAERIHLMLSPAYQLCSYLAFKWHGISFVSARASSALAGSALVIVVALCLRRHVTLFALAVGIVILGFETNMLVESRLALPEIPAAFATSISAMVLLLARQTRWNAALAGFLFTVALAFKGTVVMVAPAFFLIALLPSDQLSWRARVGRTLAFAAGAGIVVVVGLAAGFATDLLAVENIWRLGPRLLGFVKLVHPSAAGWNFFESQGHAVRNVLLLGVWCGSWIWFHRPPGPPSQAGRLYWASAVWAGWSLLVWAANVYSPGRYVVHLIVPATLNLMVGLSSGDRQTLSRIEARLKRSSGLARIAWLTWLVLPAAVVVASQLVGLAGLAGLEITKISDRAALIAALALALGLVAHHSCDSRRAVATFLLAPVIAVLLWRLGWEFELLRNFWEYQSPQATQRWLLAGGLALAASAVLAPFSAAGRHTVAIQVGIVVVAAMPLIVRAALPLWAPTFTIRDASRDIGRLLSTAAAGEIRVNNASSLFLENRLRYRELSGSDTGFDWLVVFEHNLRAQLLLRSVGGLEFEPVRSYPVTIDSRYLFDPALHGRLQIALLHRRTSQPALAPGGTAR